MKKSFKGIAAALAGLGKVAAAPETLELNLSEIHENPRNVRTQFESSGLDELAESIRHHGLIEPLVVIRRVDGSGYLLIAGHRRRRAALLIGIETLPVILRHDIADADHEKIALIENLQREDLGPMDIAAGLQAALDLEVRENGEHGARSRIAREIGKQPAYVTRYLALLELPCDVQQLARDGVIVDPQRLARLGMLDDAARDLEIERIRNPGVLQPDSPALSATTPAAAKGKVAQRAAAPADPNVDALARKFCEYLATPVAITRRGVGGEIRITFSDNDVLDGLIARLKLPTLDQP